MDLLWPHPTQKNIQQILEEAGYHFFVDPRTHNSSYVRRMARGFYPRFHLYIKEKPGGISLSVHLDQKKASYEGSRAHSGEYDGPLVEEEVARLQRWLAYYSGSAAQ